MGPRTTLRARETTINIRASNEEKEAWKEIAPNGNLSKWFRALANRELKRSTKAVSS